MDTTTANLGISREEFLHNLATSGLIPEAEFQRLSASPQAGVVGLATALLASGAITAHQLDAISQGKLAELHVGNYDIIDRLGAGGMGTVFKARHRRMKRIVALKVLSSALCQDLAFVQRFQREVETLARLGHPNIVMAYDADEAHVGHFLVMEFVNGRDLASLVERGGAMPVAQAVDCVLQAARGMAYAHAQGIVHRDIKPHNLLLDQAGVLKIADLGLARPAATLGDPASGITQAGGMLGTANYMPPEQAVDPSLADHRADIYALGCTLYYLLAGQPPFAAPSIMAVLLKHREAAPPSLQALRPDAPASLDAIYKKMLAKSPADRCQSMAEVVAALEGVLTSLNGQAAAPVPAVPVVPSGPGSSTATGRVGQNTIAGTADDGAIAVLVVEPSRVQGGIIRKYLEAQDIVVAGVVATGKEALAIVRAGKLSGIVSALHLADMTGIELARQVRAEVPANAPGFVLISSETEAVGTNPGDLNRVVLLPKPFSPEQLVRTLRVVTGKSVLFKVGVDALSLAGVRKGDSSHGTRAKADRSRVRVLIVDDSAAARAHERQVLQGLGFADFAEAHDGAQAIAAVAAAAPPFGLVVTDYNMPLMDGRALVSYLRQTPATAGLPILMVTTESAPEVLEPVRKLGVTAIFPKAFPEAAVKAALDKSF